MLIDFLSFLLTWKGIAAESYCFTIFLNLVLIEEVGKACEKPAKRPASDRPSIQFDSCEAEDRHSSVYGGIETTTIGLQYATRHWSVK